jgi:hypothetical protein
VILLDPEADTSNRRYQAWESFVPYSREVTTWLRDNGYQLTQTLDVMVALGTTLDHFYAVADEAGS